MLHLVFRSLEDLSCAGFEDSERLNIIISRFLGASSFCTLMESRECCIKDEDTWKSSSLPLCNVFCWTTNVKLSQFII